MDIQTAHRTYARLYGMHALELQTFKVLMNSDRRLLNWLSVGECVLNIRQTLCWELFNLELISEFF